MLARRKGRCSTGRSASAHSLIVARVRVAAASVPGGDERDDQRRGEQQDERRRHERERAPQSSCRAMPSATTTIGPPTGPERSESAGTSRSWASLRTSGPRHRSTILRPSALAPRAAGSCGAAPPKGSGARRRGSAGHHRGRGRSSHERRVRARSRARAVLSAAQAQRPTAPAQSPQRAPVAQRRVARGSDTASWRHSCFAKGELIDFVLGALALDEREASRRTTPALSLTCLVVWCQVPSVAGVELGWCVCVLGGAGRVCAGAQAYFGPRPWLVGR